MPTKSNDACLRTALKARLAKRHMGDPDVFIVEELPASRASTRVDLAVLNGHLHGFEIKSDLDTLDRLPRQAAAFSSALQHVTLVVAERHLEHASTLIPDWWGVTVARLTRAEKVQFKCLRRARRNLSLDPRCVAELLQRDELLTLLRRNGVDRGVRSADYAAIVDRAISTIPLDALVAEVREELKFRSAWEAREGSTAFGRAAILFNVVYRPVRSSLAVSCAG